MLEGDTIRYTVLLSAVECKIRGSTVVTSSSSEGSGWFGKGYLNARLARGGVSLARCRESGSTI